MPGLTADESLLAFPHRTARGTPLDFDEFVLARGPALVRLATALSRDPALAEDIVQDVLVTALTRWRRISAADDVDAYVRRMVVNRLTTWWRRPARREQARDSGRLPVRVVVDQAQGVVDRQALAEGLAQLPARQRAVLVLRHYEGCRDAEIADLLGCPESTVRSHARRGLVGLRRYLEECVP